MSVLDELNALARERARTLPAGDARCERADFAAALRGRERIAVVAEFKRASPSEGGIAPEKDVRAQVRRYAELGASAISVLTEPTRFHGSYDDLVTAASEVDLPLLLKDFVVDVAQVRHAAMLGASAVLLIARSLDDVQLQEFAAACRERGLTPLVECHDSGEIDRALAVEGSVIGVNNRDLATLSIDLATAPELLARVPADRVVVAESGYVAPGDVDAVRGIADAVLVGTALMRADDPARWMRTVTS